MPLTPTMVSCASLDDLDHHLRVLDKAVNRQPSSWIFRGHRNDSWTLEPRIERLCPGLKNRAAVEANIMAEFIARAHLYTDRLPSGSEDGTEKWRSMMQHYGIPTRLLDWTYSAYIALYFAVEQSSDEEHSALWAFDTTALKDADAKRKKRYEKDPDSTFQGKVLLGNPSVHVARLASQQGCFLANYSKQMDFADSLAAVLAELPEDKRPLFKFRFPSKLRPHILRRLMHLNINAATLFPDLEGFARYLTVRAEVLQIPYSTGVGPS